ncbi:MAG TPA: MerR family transcriptional regulator [Rubricoccaceae bacterium]|jgi:DNA-binding transcriptional MerR regulator
MPGIRKLYYSIREVSEATGLKPHVLRYWESEFESLRPKKNRAGNRTYTARDLDVVLRVQRLLRDEKYTIEGARHALARELAEADGAGPAPAPQADARQRLVELRAFLSDVLTGLDRTASSD